MGTVNKKFTFILNWSSKSVFWLFPHKLSTLYTSKAIALCALYHSFLQTDIKASGVHRSHRILLRQSVSLRTFLLPSSLLLAAVYVGTNSSLVALPILWKVGCMISHFLRSVHSKKTFWHLVMLIIYHFERLRREPQGLYLHFLDEDIIRSWLNGKLSTLSWYMLCLVILGLGLKI